MSQQPPEGTNYGVQQFGGQSQVANQAVGPGARATAGAISFQSLTADQRTMIDDRLALVERLLDEHRAALPDQDTPRAELRRLRDELTEPEPEPGVVRRALDRLATYAEPVAPLAAAVAALAQALPAL
ncbi:hypothetical protein Stsp02_69270 [Streptomyces sp. NBRC 14336]|uniref:DUF5955 family protein n=1 Tax=Streptomyces sp. NBRC 14336 TaxID=3030992 RepID=UPI0024A3F064|nr:DUF5955 family protein [Streptomyces sp. NBRC 14336]WBO78912.1 DUF5955 family protein [Streptomyces sp. SBE_14.2]GLW51266.1 hypothetical protein Stsp02_69270 [Streptomyces sp. NBRC 14336]